MWLKMPHWSDCLKKTSSLIHIQFSGTFVTVFSPFGAVLRFKNNANSLYFCFLVRGVSLYHWGFTLRKIFYQEWCVSTRKTWTLELGLMRMVLYELFPGVQKVFGYFFILAFLFCWSEFILVRSNYTHFCIVLWLVTRNQVLWPVYCVPPHPIPPSLQHRKCFNYIFLQGRNFTSLKFILFFLQVELRSSPLWDFHDWWVTKLIVNLVILASVIEGTRSHEVRRVYQSLQNWFVVIPS